MVVKAMADSVWVNGGGLFSDYVIEFTAAAKGAGPDGTCEHYDASVGHAQAGLARGQEGTRGSSSQDGVMCCDDRGGAGVVSWPVGQGRSPRCVHGCLDIDVEMQAICMCMFGREPT
jgi:hypothetical protein